MLDLCSKRRRRGDQYSLGPGATGAMREIIIWLNLEFCKLLHLRVCWNCGIVITLGDSRLKAFSAQETLVKWTTSKQPIRDLPIRFYTNTVPDKINTEKDKGEREPISYFYLLFTCT